MNRTTDLTHHTLVVLVENKAGVLARVTDLIARRSYNIISLAVAPTNDDRLSRITIIVDAESAPMDQIVKQLFKLINVLEIAEIAPADAISRELMLATVAFTSDNITELEALMGQAPGHVLEQERTDSMLTLSAGGSSREIDALEAQLAAFDIVEVQRTGQIALPKPGRSVPIIRAR